MINASGPCRTVGKILTTTAVTAVLAAEAFSTIGVIRLANVTATAAVVTVSWFDASENTTFHLAYQRSLSGNDVHHIQIDGFQIADGDEIRVQAGTANAVHVIVTVLEVPGRSA